MIQKNPYNSRFYFRYDTINAKDKTVLAALKHNKRELPPQSHIDSALTHFNQCLIGKGTADEIDRQVKANLVLKGLKPRKNAVLAIEVIFSLNKGCNISQTHYFNDCIAWTRTNFEGEIFSADIHRDEAHPHMHLLILPIVNTGNTWKLEGNKVCGFMKELNQRRKSFTATIGSKYDLQIGGSETKAFRKFMNHVKDARPDVFERVIDKYS